MGDSRGTPLLYVKCAGYLELKYIIVHPYGVKENFSHCNKIQEKLSGINSY